MTLSDFMRLTILTLNESPSEKEGKCNPHKRQSPRADTLNESPSEKEGKSAFGNGTIDEGIGDPQ